MPTNEIPTLSNLGPNFTCVTIGGVSVWFSYTTPIAVLSPETDGIIVRENDWSTTTGKHLNAIDGGTRADKARRIPGADFERIMSTTFAAVAPFA